MAENAKKFRTRQGRFDSLFESKVLVKRLNCAEFPVRDGDVCVFAAG